MIENIIASILASRTNKSVFSLPVAQYPSVDIRAIDRYLPNNIVGPILPLIAVNAKCRFNIQCSMINEWGVIIVGYFVINLLSGSVLNLTFCRTYT